MYQQLQIYYTSVQLAIFQGREGFLEQAPFDKHLIYNTWKKAE